jgi:hypothetical protein
MRTGMLSLYENASSDADPATYAKTDTPIIIIMTATTISVRVVATMSP